MKYYLCGQLSFANRGCEALVRSNVALLRQQHPEAEFFCPSENIELDRKQWPDAGRDGVSFVPSARFPVSLKIWGRLLRYVPAINALGLFPVQLDAETRLRFLEADAVLMTGGDIISLDYGMLNLYFWSGLMDAAHRLGKPTHLLAASVGPFKDKVVERHMVGHLKRYTTISVRESASLEYLRGLGVTNARLVADPAFVLSPQAWDTSAVLREGVDHVGLNVSPLIRKFRKDDASRQALDAEVQSFIRRVVEETTDDVVLIPHVDPLSAPPGDNSDRVYMSALLAKLGDLGGRVRVTPDLLNAAQIKYVLGKCRYFVGARTHATVGAISQAVPTCSIAYSVKAVGINEDLFGSTRYVLSTPEVTADTLIASLDMLRRDEQSIKTLLAERVPQWKHKAAAGLAGI